MARQPIEFDANDDFARLVLAGVGESPEAKPCAYYNQDGDCIEFLFSTESYYAERIDKLVTVYYGRESGQIVGSLIKGVRRFLQEILDASPGFVIDLQDGRIRLEHLFSAGMWKHGDPVARVTYKKLRDAADRARLEVELPAVSC